MTLASGRPNEEAMESSSDSSQEDVSQHNEELEASHCSCRTEKHVIGL